jgi:U3 small nucleolar ribonucleoprotein protein IMP4
MAAFGKILVTTSRNPTSTMRTFSNDLRRIIPNAVRVNRGKMSIDEIAEKALEHEVDRVIIVDRWQGGFGKIRFFKIGESGLVSIRPIVNIASIWLQREFDASKTKTVSFLFVSSSSTEKELSKVAEAFSNFFNIPALLMDATAKTNATVMHLSLAKDSKIEITFMVEPQHVEVGPRIIASSMEW